MRITFRTRLLAAVAFVLALLLATTAEAAITPTSGYSCYAGSFPSAGTRTASTPTACASIIVSYLQGAGSVHPDMVATCSGTTGAVCGWNWPGSPHGGQITVNTSSVCPGNSTLSGGSCTCNSGYVELAGTCVADTPECPVGQGVTTNRTEGWARSSNPNANDIVTDLGPPSSIYNYNDGQCVGNLTGVERCFRSAEPSAQGLHRVSCDYTMVVTGPSTTAGESNSDPTQPVVACPGFVGEVQGKTVCVGTASDPLPPGTDAPNEPTVAGNPPAGTKPLTGPGSGSGGTGRTPTTGTGGNDGGPASAAVGPGGSGLRNSEGSDDSGAVCGAAPLPACNVKVDETGTPDGSIFGTSPELDTALNNRESGLATARDKAGDAGWGIVPAWTADQACEPWEIWTLPDDLGGDVVTVNLCPLMPLAEGILNFIWAMLGIFAVTSMVSAAMTGKGT